MKVVIVGGVAGGASAAARIRRLDETAEIIVFERTGYVSYANCGLPYYIGGIITQPSALTLQTPQSFWARFRINIKVHHEVTAIDPVSKTVTVHDLDTDNIFIESYDKLILSPGAKAIIPSIPGTDLDKIFSLRTVEDTFRIHQYVQEKKPQSVVIVGGGFIGIEMAENLRSLGLQVTLIQRSKQLLDPIDPDMASFIHSEMRAHGVRLELGSQVTGFYSDGDAIVTQIKAQSAIKSDFVLLAAGIMPESTLAKNAGLKLGVRDSIVVNDRMETSVPDIYAVGDAIEVRHVVTDQKTMISLAGPANKQGRIAADNICGGDSHFKGSLGSSVLKVFGKTVAVTGISEKVAQKAGIHYEKVILASVSHATYYPGFKSLTLKVIYEKGSARLLGAQIVGQDGTDKRIDVLATAIYAGLTGVQLAELDLAYAPPYSSAKDPVNMAGFMIENLETGKVKQIHVDAIKTLPRDGCVSLIDVRTEAEYHAGSIDGFVNIPLDQLRERIHEVDPNKPVYLLCRTALRSYIACRILVQNGYECYNISGGYEFYRVSILEEQAANLAPCGIEKHSIK